MLNSSSDYRLQQRVENSGVGTAPAMWQLKYLDRGAGCEGNQENESFIQTQDHTVVTYVLHQHPGFDCFVLLFSQNPQHLRFTAPDLS